MNQQIKQLWGHDFPIVDGGLSEATVVTFVNRLMQERDSLAKGREHLVHLRQLAERMIIEAGEMSATIKQQAEAEASTLLVATRSRAAEITDEAHIIIDQSTKETGHVLDELQREADLVKAKITEEIERKVDESWAKIRDQGVILARRVEQELSTELNNLSASIRAFEVECTGNSKDSENGLQSPDLAENLLTDAAENTVAISIQGGEEISNIALPVLNNLSESVKTFEVEHPENSKDNGKEPKETKLQSPDSSENLLTDMTENTVAIQDGEETSNIALPMEEESADKCQMPEIALSPNPTGSPEKTDSFCPMHALYRGNVELDIAPPLDDDKMQMLIKELKMYGMELRNLVTSSVDQSTVNLFLRTPMDLIAVLESVDGVIICGGSNNSPHSQEPQRLNIRLRHED